MNEITESLNARNKIISAQVILLLLFVVYCYKAGAWARVWYPEYNAIQAWVHADKYSIGLVVYMPIFLMFVITFFSGVLLTVYRGCRSGLLFLLFFGFIELLLSLNLMLDFNGPGDRHIGKTVETSN